MTQQSSEFELQGWYYRDPSSEAVRVRLALTERSLHLHTLSDRLLASWSLDRLENRRIPLLGERWSIGDPHLPEASVVLESDDDYRQIREVAPKLRSERVRLWNQLVFSVVEVKGGPIILIVLLASAVAAVWQLF